MKTGFIGLGKLGLPCAEIMAEHHEVFGFDLQKVHPEGVQMCTTTKELFDKADDIVFIAVPTPHSKEYDGSLPTSMLPVKDFDYSTVETILDICNVYAQPQTLIVLISTVLPGTIKTFNIQNLNFVYNPYLIAMGTVKEDFMDPEMLIIGSEDGVRDKYVDRLIQFYQEIFGELNPRLELGTHEEAECIKIFYNTFISTKITLANMVQDVAESIGNINSDVVQAALGRSDKRIISGMYMKSGMGDGGPCHPRDNIALSSMAQKLDLNYDLFQGIMEAREQQAFKMAQKLVSYNMPVVIIGKSFKPGTDLIDGSSSLLVGHYVAKLRGDVSYDDLHPDPAVYLLAHPCDRFNAVPGSKVVDPWRKVKSSHEVYNYGNTRHIR